MLPQPQVLLLPLLLLLLCCCSGFMAAPAANESHVSRVECPADETVKAGACEGGFRTDTVRRHRHNSKGECVQKVEEVESPCDKSRSSCPPRQRKKVDSCKEGIERWLTTYYVFSEVKGRCVRKLSFKELSCRESKYSCPTPRVVESGVCEGSQAKVLVEHYEFDKTAGKCVAEKDFVTKPCSKEKKKQKKQEKRKECPEPEYHQQACRRQYRTVVKVYSEWSEVKGRCVRRLQTSEEPCAVLLKTSCPPDQTVETGPCHEGFRSNIVFAHKRDDKGACKQVELHVTEPCGAEHVQRCKSLSRKRVSPCSKEGFERWLTVYYVYSEVKKSCVKKLRIKELACRKDKCPTPRVLEPSPCEAGKQKVLIEHYEKDEKSGECRKQQDFVHKPCGQDSKRQLAAKKHNCPDSVFHQQPCRGDGYRQVVKFYYRFNKEKGKCVKNVKTDEEKCSKLPAVKAGCKPDEVVETGPCGDGFREDIVFKYARSEDGSCERVEHRVSVKCDDEG